MFKLASGTAWGILWDHIPLEVQMRDFSDCQSFCPARTPTGDTRAWRGWVAHTRVLFQHRVGAHASDLLSGTPV